MSFFLINDIRLNLPMGWVPFQLLYLGPFSNVRCTFDWNGEYYNSNQEGVAWNYEYIEPDSLILFHHGFYEERYKILNITKDTLMVRLSEYIFHTSENGQEIEAQYGDGLQPTYIYVRKK